MATGWYGQAATLLENDTESAEYGLLLIVSGYTVLMGGNIDAGRELLEQARDVSHRVGDQDVEGLASIYLGHALVTSGDQAAGLAMVDEATAAAMSGRLGIQAAGTIYCSTIFLCRNIGDWRRAGRDGRARPGGASENRSASSPDCAGSITPRSCGSEGRSRTPRKTRSPPSTSS